jgi:hypothetical protein
MSIFENGQGQIARVPIMTQAQKDELARVNGLQIRTNAANLAAVVLQNQRTSEARFVKFARHIELYIRGELPANGAATPVRSGAEAG